MHSTSVYDLCDFRMDSRKHLVSDHTKTTQVQSGAKAVVVARRKSAFYMLNYVLVVRALPSRAHARMYPLRIRICA